MARFGSAKNRQHNNTRQHANQDEQHHRIERPTKPPGTKRYKAQRRYRKSTEP